MTVHTLYNTGKKFLILFVVFVLIVSLNAECVFAYSQVTDLGNTTEYSYKGKYDLSAHHDVNVYWNPKENLYDEESIDSILQTCYQQFRAWGITPNGAAAMVGNFRAEGAEPTVLQDWVDWDDFVFGKTGFGLMGFTYWSVQADVFNLAAEQGKSWTDLGVQLQIIRDGYMHPEDKSIAKEFYEDGYTVEELSDLFCAEYERPKTNNFADRRSYSKDYYNKFKDLPPKDYDGSLASSSGSSQVDTITGANITNEWDLVGMPRKSGLVSEVNIPTLAKRENLSITEQYNLVEIGKDISRTKEFDAWTTGRVVVIFIGILMMIYTLLMALAVIFDNWNNFINISLVGVLSLGVIHYVPNILLLKEEGVKYTSTKRMIVLLIVMFLISGLLISGGIIPFILQSIYNIVSHFN